MFLVRRKGCSCAPVSIILKHKINALDVLKAAHITIIIVRGIKPIPLTDTQH
jgi:hypothetical protein